MILDKIVVDNFFSNKELTFILEDSQSCEYYDCNTHPDAPVSWSGVRTKNLLHVNYQRYSDIINKIFKSSIQQSFGEANAHFTYKWKAHLHFHILKDKFQESWIHRDNNDILAGIIYLNKNPEVSSGTSLIYPTNTYNIDNVFNRLVIYNGKILHAPQNGFNNRLTLSFFITSLTLQADTDISL